MTIENDKYFILRFLHLAGFANLHPPNFKRVFEALPILTGAPTFRSLRRENFPKFNS